MHGLAIVTGLLLGVDASADRAPPPYLPRSVAIGVFWNEPVVSPHVRLQWELSLIEQPPHGLLAVAALGSGFAIDAPSTMTDLFQHVATAGVAYRGDRGALTWGVQLTAGALWYRAFYRRGSLVPGENRVVGCVEGRLQLGVRVLPHFRVAALFGYSSPLDIRATFPGSVYSGGFDLGVLIDWR